MVKHIILWKLRENLTDEQRSEIKEGIKNGLTGLLGQIPGLEDVKVHTCGLPTSANCDLMLDCSFTDVAALKSYAGHPLHVAVADGKVRPYVASRTCFDFEI